MGAARKAAKPKAGGMIRQTANGAAVIEDPGIEIGPYKVMQRTDGMFVVVDPRRPPAYQTCEVTGTVDAAETQARARLERGALLPIVTHCPNCDLQHIDTKEEIATPHREHVCAGCATRWTPDREWHTVGVAQIPNITAVAGR